jgi:hypothetical protein
MTAAATSERLRPPLAHGKRMESTIARADQPVGARGEQRLERIAGESGLRPGRAPRAAYARRIRRRSSWTAGSRVRLETSRIW